MARISEEELERIKREVAIERLVQARGIELRRHGKDLLGLCPFHDDHEPSLVITPEKNLWHCLGACQTGGSVIDWVMRAEGISFRHATELLRNEIFSFAASSSSVPVVKQSTVPKLAAPISVEMSDAELTGHVVDYYHATFKQSPEALAYLKERGVDSAEAIDHFRIGFANRTLGLRLPAKNRKEGAELRTRLAKLGLIRETGHEHFNGSIVMPIVAAAGEVTEMYGRKITANLRPGTPLHLYLPGPHRGIWNLDALRSGKEIILCEALLDALTFWCAGFRNVTASYGIEGFTSEHLEAFKAYGTEHVLIAYDRDDSGDRAAAQLAEKLIAANIAVSRIEFPRGMDANEYALKVEPAAQSLGVLVRGAAWIGGVPRVAGEQAAKAAKEEATSAAVPQIEPVEVRALSLAAASSSSADELSMQLGDRRYRVRGLAKNSGFDALRVNLMVSREAPLEQMFVDTLDLYSAKQRAAFEREAAKEIGVKDDVVRRDLGALLRQLEQRQDAAARAALTPAAAPAATMGDGDRAAALELLCDPRLVDRILSDFAACGVVGEEVNKLIGYVAAVSRKLEQPLAIIVQSSSAAGKSALMEAVLSMMPEEERVQYSAMTGQSLFYMGETDLKHKILAIAEEEGAERASYALKLLQSEGQLTIASTGKDPQTGKLVTHEYHVEGPVMIFLTTTAIEIDEELLNRCIVLTVDEDREQTRAIHKLQREAQTLEGLLAKRDADYTRTLHRNAQRLLEPILVANPHARELTFADARTRTRRDHMKYLTLIRAIALLHQHQRARKSIEHKGQRVDYIEVTREDIALADRLAGDALVRSDDLPPQTMRLLDATRALVRDECERQGITTSDVRFTRKQLRELVGWSETQVRNHIDRLVRLDYFAVHRGAFGLRFVYELVSDDPPPQSTGTTPASHTETGHLAQTSHGPRIPARTTSHTTSHSRNVSTGVASLVMSAETPENAHRGDAREVLSYARNV